MNTLATVAFSISFADRQTHRHEGTALFIPAAHAGNPCMHTQVVTASTRLFVAQCLSVHVCCNQGSHNSHSV